MACCATIVAVTSLVPLQGVPGQIRLGLHVVDGVHLGVLVVLVELDTAGDAGESLGGGQRVADRLRVLGAALYHIGDQHDLVVGMRRDVGRIRVELGLEGRYEV